MNRKRKRAEAVLDFTSLLDVIFIILLLVMSRQQLMANETIASQEQLSEEKVQLNMEKEAQREISESANAVLEMYAEEIELHSNIDSYAPCIIVYANYLENNPSERHIRVKLADKEIGTPYNLYADNTSVVYQNFHDNLCEFIEQNPDRPVLLSLNEGDENILYRDEVKIMEIFNSLREQYDNVFIK